jgi:FkbM family methyltransferase
MKIDRAPLQLSEVPHMVVGAARTFRNWPRVIGAIALQRMGYGANELFAVGRDGTRVASPNTPWARAPIFEVFVDDIYGFRTLAAPRAGALRVLDVGAHIGTFTLALCATHPLATCVCIEPSPTAFRYLARNVVDNGLAARVHVVNAAIAGQDGSVTFFENEPGSCIGSLTPTAPGGDHAASVDAMTFGSVTREHGPFDVIKLDCEGAEYAIILGSDPSCWQSVMHLIVEYHPSSQGNWDELGKRLVDLGFILRWHRHQAPEVGIAYLARPNVQALIGAPPQRPVRASAYGC